MDDETEEKPEDVKPIEVKITNEKPRESTPYDDEDDPFNDEIKITKDQIRDFEDGNT